MSPLALAAMAAALAARPIPAARELSALADYVEQAHPDPFRYASEAEWRARVEAEVAAVAADPSKLGRAVHRVLAPLRDGHFAVALPEIQPGRAPIPVIPLFAVRAGEGWVVDAAPGLAAGDELLAIDGRPMDVLVAELEELVLADGLDREPRLAAIEQDLPRWWLLEHGPVDSVVVRVRTGEFEREVTLTGVPHPELAALGAQRTSELRRREPAPALDFLDPGVALLELPAFGMADQRAWRESIDALWPVISAAPALILDVRGNPGGFRPNGFAVLDHLLGEPYPQWTRIRGGPLPKPRRFASVEPLFPESSIPRGPFEQEGDPLEPQMRPSAEPYPGKIAVLVDGRTTSAANTFVLALERVRPDTLVVGRSLGGACDAHVGELPVVYTTGPSQTRVLLSLFAIDHLPPDRCVPGHGLVPDLEVRPTVEQRREGIDADVQAALEALY